MVAGWDLKGDMKGNLGSIGALGRLEDIWGQKSFLESPMRGFGVGNEICGQIFAFKDAFWGEGGVSKRDSG